MNTINYNSLLVKYILTLYSIVFIMSKYIVTLYTFREEIYFEQIN